MTAHTGVAGAKNIDSVFKLTGEDSRKDLVGPKLSEFVESLKHARILVIDDISTVSGVQFEMVSRRLEQAAKVLYRQRYGLRAPASFDGFGGLHVLLVGDFGQISPASGSLNSKKQAKGEHRHLTKQGQERFRAFENVICFRRAYRFRRLRDEVLGECDPCHDQAILSGVGA